MSCLHAPDNYRYFTSQHGLKGFTLIELIVTVTIIVILSAAAIPSFNSYLRVQALRQAQEQVKNDLRTIQNKALTGALSDVSLGSTPTPVAYWGVRFAQNSSDYQYFISTDKTAAACTNFNSSSASPAGQQQGSGKLPASMSTKTSTRCIFFSIKDGSANCYIAGTGNACSSVIFGYTGTVPAAECRSVEFNPVGAIYSKSAPLSSCTN